MAPGDLLAPAQLSEGALVQAEDPGGFWYNAKVIQKTGHGKRAKVTVRWPPHPVLETSPRKEH